MNESIKPADCAQAFVQRGARDTATLHLHGLYTVRAYSPDGNLKWQDTAPNLVTTAGKNDLLDRYFDRTSVPGWYLGLISSISYGAGPNVADTMISHLGWREAGQAFAPSYSQSARPAISWAPAGSAAKAFSTYAVYNITGGGVVKGCFLTTDSSKDGITGLMYSVGLFAEGDKTLSPLDTLTVLYSAFA